MTRKEAIREISERIELIDKEKYDVGEYREALQMAITAIENIGHLKDRPCSVCEFNKENGCCKWTCVFTDRLFGNMRGAE